MTANTETDNHSLNINADKQLLVVAHGRDRIRLVHCFREAGYSVAGVCTYGEAYAYMDSRGVPNLIILIMQETGPESFLKARTLSRNGEVPVFVLSNNDDADFASQTISEFADEYMRMPYHDAEMLARVYRVLLRTAQFSAVASPARVKVADRFYIDFSSGDTIIDNHHLLLTPIEAKIVKILHDWHGQVVPYDAMTTLIWGSSSQRALNSLWVHVRRLREKIETNPQSPRRLLTVRGVGYCLSNGPDEGFTFSVVDVDRADSLSA